MKGIDIFCASQAATAICLSMEQQPSLSSSTNLIAGGTAAAAARTIDRHNPLIRDARRIPKQILAPCTASQSPISPKSHKNHQKKKNETKILENETNGDCGVEKMRKSCSLQSRENGVRKTTTTVIGRKSWSCTRPGGFISPPGSTRYLLSEKVIFNNLTDLDPSLIKKSPPETSMKTDESSDAKPPSTTSATSPDQVVVLRVSLHCRGCVTKMSKHIKRMEGVTSFNIDFAAKKVTVSGNITPLEVLSSISKVKNAQLWSPEICNNNNINYKVVAA